MMKKRLTALLLALTLLLSVTSAVSAAQTVSFTDVPKGAYYYDAVNWAVEKEITDGTSETTFEPDTACTRAQVVTFLWRLDGKPAVSAGNIFTDVPKNEYYHNPVLWAVKEKVTDGVADGIFQPSGTCTRGQIVTFLWRYAGEPNSLVKNPFNDVQKGSWYETAVKWAVEKGITDGLTETTFGPDEPCTRAQVVTFLHRYAEGMTKPPVGNPDMGDWA